MTENKKSKTIDLGALQDAYQSAKKTLEADAKVLARAQESFTASKKRFQETHEALKSGSQAVLN